MNSIILMGSARGDGNSHLIAQAIQEVFPADRVDLHAMSIGPFTYTHDHRDDDFIPLVKQLITYDTILFLTPVYWYSMSGLMKTFLDRLTDCLQIEKELGRQLKGKSMICVACGSDSTTTEGYFVPFKETAEYLGMNYLGGLHTWKSSEVIEPVVISKIQNFFKTLDKQ